MRRSNGYPVNKPLPTDAIDLERQSEPEADHLDADELAQIWQVLKFEEKTAVRDASGTRVRDRAIIAVLSHGLRASEASALNIEHWNGKILKVHRSKAAQGNDAGFGTHAFNQGDRLPFDDGRTVNS